jgi:hypothetical protein
LKKKYFDFTIFNFFVFLILILKRTVVITFFFPPIPLNPGIEKISQKQVANIFISKMNKFVDI